MAAGSLLEAVNVHLWTKRQQVTSKWGNAAASSMLLCG